MEKKPNFKQWNINYKNHDILISNWWGWDLKGSADLYIDDQHLDQDTSIVAETNRPLLKTSNFSDNISSLEVYVAGLFSVKISVLVNGVNIYSDRLNMLDRLFIKKSTQAEWLINDRKSWTWIISCILESGAHHENFITCIV